MRKLIESTLVSLDGVIESPDRWAPFDQEAGQLAIRDLDNYDAFVMGREGYERLRALWAPVTGNPYIEKINAMPKYVASQSAHRGDMERHAPRTRHRRRGRATQGPTGEGPHQVRHEPPRRHPPGRAPDRRAAAMDHARLWWASANACSKTSTPRFCRSSSPTFASWRAARSSSPTCPANSPIVRGGPAALAAGPPNCRAAAPPQAR
jgi:hypothetical protein